MSMVKKHFRPEFINRLDEIVIFKPLNATNLAKVLEIQLREISARLASHKLGLEVTPRACQFILDSAYKPEYGARPLKRFLERNIVTRISRMLIADEDKERKNTRGF